MTWSVVEVKPEPDHRLFIRFQDAVEEYVHLRPAELTGVLAQLRSEELFAQAFVEYGAVAWPGEVDLAPDAI
jgi:hypothetical protein